MTGKLKPDNAASEGYLSVAQTETLILYLTQNTYRYSYQIIDYIFESWGASFSISGLNKCYININLVINILKVPHKFDEKNKLNLLSITTTSK